MSTERANFKVTINNKKRLSEREQYLRKSVNLRPVTLQQILAYIDIQNISAELKEALRTKAQRYPNQALQRFADNFNQILNTTQRNLNKTYIVKDPDAKVVRDEDAVRPTRQYVPVKQEPIVAKKIDLSSIQPDRPSEPVLVAVELPKEVDNKMPSSDVFEQVEEPLVEEPFFVPPPVEDPDFDPKEFLRQRLAMYDQMEFE